MTGNCTLSDVAYVKLHTSLYKDNKELGSLKENATKFLPHWTNRLPMTWKFTEPWPTIPSSC